MGKSEILHKNNVHSKIDKKKVAVWSISDDYYIGKPDCHYESIETPTQQNTRRELWVEYKHIKELPKLDKTMVKPKWSSDLQEAILTRKFRNRGNARVVIFVGGGHACRAIMFNNPMEWINGLSKTECERRATTLKELAEFIEKFVTSED